MLHPAAGKQSAGLRKVCHLKLMSLSRSLLQRVSVIVGAALWRDRDVLHLSPLSIQGALLMKKLTTFLQYNADVIERIAIMLLVTSPEEEGAPPSLAEVEWPRQGSLASQGEKRWRVVQTG
jgi:hypothetical protein